jgi:hypothetical protein
MNKSILLKFFVLAVMFISCKPSQRITTAWVNPDRPKKKYTTVFVAALMQNNGVKYALEGDMGAAVKAKGFNVVRGYEIFPPNFNKENMKDRDLALSLIRKKGCDVILAMAVIDQQSESRYVPGSGVSVGYSPYGGYGPYGTYGGYGMGFYGYYSYWAPVLYSPGYYTTDRTYFIEANAYDVETQQLLWSVQSKAENPDNIELLMEQFEKDRKK